MKTSTIKKYSYTVIAVIIIILSYQIISWTTNNDLVFPSFTIILKDIFNILTSFDSLKLLFFTLFKTILIIIVSLIISIFIAFIYIIAPQSLSFFRVFNIFIKASPFALFSIYLYYCFGTDPIIPFIITLFVVLPITFEGLIGAVDNIDNSIKDDLRLLNISGVRKYTDVYIPMCFPYATVSFLQSFGLGIKVMIMAEYICFIPNTIGTHVINLKNNWEFDYVLAWLVVIVILVSIVDLLINILKNKIEINFKYKKIRHR